MKIKEIEHLCFENNLLEFDLLIDFIKRITEKKEITYQKYEFDINKEDVLIWIKRFKSGNPIKEMNQTEKKKLISVIIHKLDN